jgi:nitrogen regulatory protein P-II 1
MTMKRIQAIIRATKFEEVRIALHEIGIEFFVYYDVKGATFQNENKISYRGTSSTDGGSILRRNIEIIVPAIDADEVVACIKQSAHTGTVGDGKIYISTIDEAVRISI